jgi:hypothetical protein
MGHLLVDEMRYSRIAIPPRAELFSTLRLLAQAAKTKLAALILRIPR